MSLKTAAPDSSRRRAPYVGIVPQMLEEPAGIKKLLTPGDSQGINMRYPNIR